MRSTGQHVSFRAPDPSDWAAILEVANQSVAGVPGAGSQAEWLENRRRLAERGGAQRHFVAESPSSGDVLGFAALESEPIDPRAFRLFVVANPSDLSTVGSALYDHAFSALQKMGAQRAWFTEYAADATLVAFAVARGFREVRASLARHRARRVGA